MADTYMEESRHEIEELDVKLLLFVMFCTRRFLDSTFFLIKGRMRFVNTVDTNKALSKISTVYCFLKDFKNALRSG